MDILPILAQSQPDVGSHVALWCIAACAFIVLACFVAWAWTTVQTSRLDHSLKHQMIERGMSAEEIVAVLTSSSPAKAPAEPPCACEVVVDSGGYWQTGLILKREGDRYLVHIVGTEMSDNQWITSERLRFAAAKEGEAGMPPDAETSDEFLAASHWSGNGQTAKPAPLDREI
jgi:hypothetical protein